MPNVFKFNIIQADFPFIAEDYGSIADTTGPDTVDFGEGLPVQSVPDYSTDLYYPLDANGELLQNPGSFDETVQTYDSTGLTEDQAHNPAYLPYLNYGFIYETQDQYPGGGLTVEGITGEAKTTKDYTPPLDLYIILAGEVLKKLVKVWVGTGQLFEIREDGGIRLIRQTGEASGTLRFDESTVGATEKVSFNPPENNQLYSISGSSVEKFVAQTPEDTILFTTGGVGLTKQEWNYGYYGDDNDPGTSGIITLDAGSVPTNVVFTADWVGAGSLFGFGEKEESVTWSYNKSSVGFGTEDWGYVYDQAAPISWGFITTPVGGVDDNWGLITETDLIKRPFGTIFFDQTTEGETRLLYLYEVTGAGTSGGITISGRPLVHPEVDYTPHYGIDKNIGIGTTGIQISGEIEDPIRTFSHVGLGTLFTTQGAAESITWDPPVGTVLYDFSGTGLEALSAQTPERTVNVVISGVGTDEKFTAREVGVASTITLTGTLVERQTDDYVGSGIATISGAAATREIGVYGYYGDDRDPGTSGIITVFGELNHPDIDYTPHYGIDKNIGIGTTGILFSIGPAGFDIAGNPIGGRYYSPIYPGNAGGVEGPGSPGIGTFRLNDDRGLTITRALLPYFGGGTINVTGIASEAYGNQVDDDVTTALFDISGVGSCREIANYGYYGDDRDPGTSGIITISTQTAEMVERRTFDYVGSGTGTFSGSASDIKVTNSQIGTGSLFVAGGSAESRTADPADGTVLYTFSGQGSESYQRAPVIGSGVITLSNDPVDVKTTSVEEGSGRIVLSGESKNQWVPNYPGGGLFRIGKSEPTCDSVDIGCDSQDESDNSFTRQSSGLTETALIQISDAAATAEEDLFVFEASGTITLTSAGETKVLRGFSQDSTVDITLSGIGAESFTKSTYQGSGSLRKLSGAAERVEWAPVGGVVLVDIDGSAETRLESDYPYVGIGQITLSGSGSTKVERDFTDGNTVLFKLSGELLFPDVRFIPNFNGGGTITILGSGDESISRPYNGTGGLFGLASGLEAYARTPYIGVGTIYLGKYDPNGEAAQGPGGLGGLAGGGASGGGTEKREFEPERVYVCII
tara:strand:- start:4025 stop:7288 length:3264 start_codon:yes stop_codon:yes gene_type:complete